jgi:hypothetical protein
MPQSIHLTKSPQREEALNDHASVPAAATNRAIYEALGTFIAQAGKLQGLTHSAWAMLKRAKRVPWYKNRWQTAVGVAAVLVVACWIGFRDRRPASPLGVSGLQGSNALDQQMPFAPAKGVLPNSTSKPQTALGLEPEERKTSRSMPQPVLDRNIRVRYISDDVTVRYFTPKPPPLAMLDGNIRVRYISDDVTVRYFTPNSSVAPPSPVGGPAQPVSR